MNTPTKQLSPVPVAGLCGLDTLLAGGRGGEIGGRMISLNYRERLAMTAARNAARTAEGKNRRRPTAEIKPGIEPGGDAWLAVARMEMAAMWGTREELRSAIVAAGGAL